VRTRREIEREKHALKVIRGDLGQFEQERARTAPLHDIGRRTARAVSI